MTIGAGDFNASSSADYRSAHAAELCGALASLQSIYYCLSKLNDSSMIDVSIATYCLGVVRRLERRAQVISIAAKLHHIVREFLLLKSKRFKSIAFVKVDAYQDDVKSFDKLTLLEQLNAKCDSRAKALTLNVSEEVVIPFPLVLSSLYAMIATNQLILNYPKDTRLYDHFINCEEHLNKALKISDFRTID